MTISYPLNMPSSPGPRRVNIFAVSTIAVSRSPYTLKEHVHAFQGQAWGAEVILPTMTREQADEWTSWLLSLNGPQGTFRLGDPLAEEPRGLGPSGALVKGGGQSGQSLLIDGLPLSTSGILLKGDYIEVEQRLYKVLSDVASDGSGEATLDIWPRLRTSPIDNTNVLMRECKGLFRLTQTTNPVYGADENKYYEFSFSCIEAI